MLKVLKISLLFVGALIPAITQALPADAQPDVFVTTEDNDASGNVLTNDIVDIGNGRILVSITDPSEGGSTVWAATGDVTYTPPANVSGNLTFSYVMQEVVSPTCDGAIAPSPPCFSTGTGTYQVAPVADSPVLVAAGGSGLEDNAVNLGLSATLVDTDGSQSTELVGISGVPAGATIGGGVDIGGGLWAVPAASVAGATLAPAPNYNGTLNLVAVTRTTDTAPGFADDTVNGTAVPFAVSVTSQNDAPIAGTAPSITTDEDVNAGVSMAGAFTDVDIATNADVLTYTVDSWSHPAIASATMSGSSLSVVLVPGLAGTGNVVVRATDIGLLSDTISVAVTVNAVNDAPTIVNPVGAIVVDEDDPPESIDISTVFDDADIATDSDSLSYSAVEQGGASGLFTTVSASGTTLSIGFVAEQNGSAMVDLTATDTNGASVTQSISVSVNAVNDQPFVATAAPTLTTVEDMNSSVSLAGVFDDVDIATNGDTLSYAVVSNSNSAVNVASMGGDVLSVTLFPHLYDTGTIVVRATDSGGLSEDVSVTVNVTEVNDPPAIVNPVTPITVDEDGVNPTGDISAVFSDPDTATHGDTLSYSVVEQGGASGLFDSVALVGNIVTLDLAQDQNGAAIIDLTATDGSGVAVTHSISVTVNAVNDQPTLTGVITDVSLSEDDPTRSESVDVFDDVDIVTNADVLTYSVFSNTNPGLFSAIGFSGSNIDLTSAFDANGTADIVVRATDLGGLFAEDTFTVTVTSVNDIPVAADDVGIVVEDTLELRIPVLANDYLAEIPTTITAINHTGTHAVLDNLDNPITYSNANVYIDGAELVYEPTEHFYGDDTFTYTITDVNGDTSTATITVTVSAVNDPPEGPSTRSFSMDENETLTISAAGGLLLAAYDVDGARLDDLGNPLGANVTALQQSPPTDSTGFVVGVLTFDSVDGSFDYEPPLDYFGDVSFTYRLFDNETLSVDPAYIVNIQVNEVVVVVITPTPGVVSETYTLSQTPLEQSGTVPPNVFVLMDDSGSMDMNLVVSGDDVDGGLLVDNSAIATRRQIESTISYMWDLDNAYPSNSSYGLIAPTEDALNADIDMTGNEYGIWRTRNYKFNKTYYNPEIYYQPWPGQDEDDAVFVNAVPTAIRMNPVDPDVTWNLLAPHTYAANSFPIWSTSGGSKLVDVNNLYIPFYYTTSADAPLVWNDAHTKVEILAGSTYTGGADRDDCRPGGGDPTLCTYDQEIQNFANYMQYYRHREYVTKGALGQVIENVTDLRIGFDTISNVTAVDVEDMNETHTEGNKKALLDGLYSFDSFGGTPLRQLLGRGARTLGCQVGADCPALPAPEGNCQQNFALLFTDGYWNGGSGVSTNTDEDGAGVFDGGRYADTVSQTLADVAMEYYENDLFPGVDNEVPVSARDIAGAPAGTFDGVETMHQHVKTYAIAFGVEGTIDADAAEAWDVGTAYPWPDPFDDTLFKLDDVVHTAVNGRGDFLSAGNPRELQAAIESAFLEFSQAASSASAAAFNSTSLRDGTLLYRGFYDLRDRTGEITATEVSNAGVIAATPDWLASEELDAPTKLPNDRVLVTWNPVSETGVPFRFASLAPAQQITLDGDKVDYMRGVRTQEQPLGDLRTRNATSGLLGPIINSSPVFVGSPRAINRDQAPFPTDDLYSDFVNTYDTRTEVVYVGANDGMMHGFAAQTGEELFGYVPNMILDSSKTYSNKLNDFSSPFYYHNYYVDLSPRLNDIYMRPSVGGSKQWMTALVGGLGSGGKGFFALNVTNPTSLYATETSASAAILWEFTDEDDSYPEDSSGNPIGGSIGAITDPNGNPIKDMGYANSLPVVQMTNLNDGGTPARNEWAAIFGNGANSTAGYSTLFVLLMDAGIDGWSSGDFVKIPTDYGPALPGEQQAGFPNGLGAPTSVDADLNGTVDYVYAGDRLGNLFRFDLTSDDSADWHAVHLFKATYNDGVDDIIQPILSKPLVVKNLDGLGFMVIFGTGSYLSSSDASNTEIQSIYGIWDRLDNNPATTNSNTKADRLVQQTITNVVDDSGAVAITRRIVSRNAVDLVADGGGIAGTYGWYIDLDMERAADTISGAANPDISGQAPPNPQFAGERAIRRIVFRNGALITTTILPATDEFSCSGVRPGSVLVMNAFSGGDVEEAIIDFNNDGIVDDGDLIEVDGEFYSGGLLFNQNDLDGVLVDLSTLGGEGDTDFLFISGGNDTEAYRITGINEGRTGRLSWVELQDAN